jgi:hypothetical protein
LTRTAQRIPKCDAGAREAVDFRQALSQDAEALQAEPDGQQSTGGDPAQGASDKRQVAEALLSGKPSLSAQIKAAGRDGLMAESLALLESLLQAAGVDDIGQAA